MTLTTIAEFQMENILNNTTRDIPITIPVLPSDLVLMVWSKNSTANITQIRHNGATIDPTKRIKQVFTDSTSGAQVNVYAFTGLSGTQSFGYVSGGFNTASRMTIYVVRGLTAPVVHNMQQIGWDSTPEPINTPVYITDFIKRNQCAIVITDCASGTGSTYPYNKIPSAVGGWFQDGITTAFSNSGGFYKCQHIIADTAMNVQMGIICSSSEKLSHIMLTLGTPIPEVSGWGIAI